MIDDSVDKYKNSYHNTIKRKPIGVESNSYAEYSVDSNYKYPKFQFGDHVRISKYKKFFVKGYTSNWSFCN